MSDRIAAERIVDCLVEAGIDHFFGLPGGATMEIYKALHGRESEIRPVVPRDEQTASCMADMYGKLTGKPGVFAAQGAFAGSTGMFGVIEAYLASTPMLVLTEMTDTNGFVVHGPIQSGAGQYGSFDLPSVLRGATKYTATAHQPREAVIGVQLGLKHALSGRPGPAACIFRANVLAEPVADGGLPEIHDTTRLLTTTKTLPPDGALDAVAEALAGAERPVIVAGNGVRIARAFDALRDLAEALGAPVVTSYLGKSALAETHDLAAGGIGYTGMPVANDTVGAADTILVVGCRLKPQETCYEHPAMFDPARQRIFQIDIDPRNASWTIPAEIALTGDAGLTLVALVERLRGRVSNADVRRKAFAEMKAARGLFAEPASGSDARPILPQRFVAEVASAAPEDAIVCSDAGNNRHWMNHFFRTRRAGCYFGSGGIGGVSWSMAAALAAAIIEPARPAIGVCSDGGFAMQMHALLTGVQYGAAPIHVVMNNSRLGMTAEGMGNRSVGNEFPDTDYAKIASAMGAEGVRVDRPGDVGDAVRAAVEAARGGRDRPTVIDAVIEPNESMRQAIYSPLATEAARGVRPSAG
jgi:acetolactate synthase-1/2/3 large subunit